MPAFVTYIYAIVRAIVWCSDVHSHDELVVLDEFFHYEAPLY